VATSVLELGVDVGNLDRVIQIDSPTTVSSLLQRMGRTGRRQGTVRNCLFLATRDETLLQAAGLIDLWREGYVEPIQPPPEPYHVLAQQLMALVLQEQGIGRRTWLEWVAGVPGFADLPPERIHEVVAWMLALGMLWEEQGILGIGQKGEETYGRRHFLELLSVFLSPPLFAVLHGRQELGFVDELTFLGKQDGPRVLLLGGRAWHVTHVDWQRKVAHVEVSEDRGHTRWKGVGQGLSFRVCQAIKRVLAEDESRPWWSQRAGTQIEEVRGEFPWVTADGTAVVGEEDRVAWWTFAGQKANAALAPALANIAQAQTTSDNLAIEFGRALPLDTVHRAIDELRGRDPSTLLPEVNVDALEGMKFSACLPPALAVHVLGMRSRDPMAVEHVLGAPVRLVSGS
jgi:ATP-dependent helicase Lhr and Lhr-like helicase